MKRHRTLKGLSPAMVAGVSKTLWSMEDLAEMVDATTAMPPAKRGSDKPRQPKPAAQISN